MKAIKLIWALSIMIIMAGCSNDQIQNEISPETKSKVKLPSFENIDFKLPEVPNYFEDYSSGNRNVKIVNVNPGNNQLQNIIDNAPPGTSIILQEGAYIEDNPIVINHNVRLEGKGDVVLSLGGVVGIVILNANNVRIKNISLENLGSSVLGVAVENSEKFEFSGNSMTGFLLSIILEHANSARIHNNYINGINTSGGLGVVAMNGEKIIIEGNEVNGNLFGLFLTDKNGLCIQNQVENNSFGIILCKIAEGAFAPFFSSGSGGSDFSCEDWTVVGNKANNNIWGYIVIDGANNNQLANNSGMNNVFIDMELAGETVNLFGFPVPGSFNNKVNAGKLNYLDCGVNNSVNSGVQSDLPCSD